MPSSVPAVTMFVLSRSVVFVLLIIGSQLTFLRKVYSNSMWETEVRLRSERVAPELQRMVMIGDAWWYRSIAVDGYARDSRAGRATNLGFFPLYPMAVRYLGVSSNFALDGAIISNIAFLISLILLGSLAIRTGCTAEDANRAVFYLAIFPSSYFFSLPLTESLFLALSLISFLGAFSGKWWLAGVAGGFAAATRINGVLLFIALVAHALTQRPRRL